MTGNDVRIASVKAAALACRGGRGLSVEETVIVTVTTEDGQAGYGEANAAPEVVKAYIERGWRDRSDGWDDSVQTLLIGADPSDPRALWQKLRGSTFWSARAGACYAALAGVDMALWDLAGKIHGVPTWQLLGEQRNDELRAYVTLYHGRGSFREALPATLETADVALAAGYTAFKVEAVPENTDTPGQAVELVHRVRERIGPDNELLLDFGYRFRSFDEAHDVLLAVGDLGLWAIEAPFLPDQIEDYEKLRDALPAVTVATGDCLTAPHEHFPLLDAGLVDVAQASGPRTGISGMDELARYAAARQRRLIPWGWVTSALSVAANIHLSAVHANVPLVEYGPASLYPVAILRSELAGPEPLVDEGRFVLPTAPGLGVEPDPDAMLRFAV